MPDYDDLKRTLRALESMPSDQARKLLLDDTTPALLLYVAAIAFYGPTVASYEPETLWFQLDVPMANRDKLLAALTLQVFPQFYWDLRVFGHTCLAFNEQAAYTEQVPQPQPEHIAVAVIEARLIFQLDSDAVPEFDDEVSAYVAACLAHEGIAYAPDILSFSEEHLHRILSPEGKKLGIAMKNIASEEHPKADPESALGVQLARYNQINTYVSMRLTELATRIASLTPKGHASSPRP